MRTRSSAVFVGVASLGILIAVAAGLAVIGTPGNIRLQRLDDTRSQNLRTIANAIQGYHQRHGALPERLEQVQQDAFLNVRLEDVETGTPYEYRALDASAYELCAQFSTASDEADGALGNSVFWKHASGRHCFTLQATTRYGPAVINRVF